MSVDYGKETSCTTGLRTGRYVTGARLVGEAIFRRLTTPRGMLRGGADEENYGIDLAEMIGTSNPKTLAASLPARIRAEVIKDERVEDAQVTVVQTNEGLAVAFDIAITVQTGAGPFTLKVAATEVTTTLLGLTEG